VFFYTLICLSHHEFLSHAVQCGVCGVESYSSLVSDTHTHTVKMKSNDSRVLTVVFLDLRRVTLHTTGEREGGKWPVFSEEQCSSYHRGRGREIA